MEIWKVAILVDNLDEAIDYYTNVLGMSVIRRKAKSLHLDAGNVRIELIAKEVYKDDERLGRLGVHHLSIKTDDIEKTASDLKAKGVKFIKEPVDRGLGLKIAFFDGLNGVNLQLYDQKEET
ncbi:MAG: VOC family protein [Spirochaetia bacterium]|jgi:catechol 2,3-dioxygenase-like lactoylglutathione lyase family enzyme|uniref:VOC domain-containing protein n=1 Tax=uncultured Spirochaetota bacterium TaxID=460511 RepID=A0A652ZX15_9SPIR|nr:VOC family protein [Spirochaetia bacterium]MCE1208837.1 VOC family protein [Spirochaetia bacterium]OPX91095.1 MAG: Glyoxalase/Bleomycin resistance protein/Dioxygenase superfamily protein [Pelotomaculum sp. PtaB.Bin104]VBB40358.1 conserved hypothetical protein [uncultured Spirochaetota bacterium]HOI23651.1 VOC family protein [Spirochaetales bacterium]